LFFYRGHINFVVASRSTGVDLKNYDQVRGLVKKINPGIINCAADVGSLNQVTQRSVDVTADKTETVLVIYKAIAA
jgi:hypothetical protein